MQIKDSDVTSLKHTKVTPPGDSLESANGDSYFGTNSQYAVKGGKYAGGYAGCVDIDSAAAVGGGLKLLGNIELTNLLKALDVVASTIENSDVNGCVGGYSVLADGRDDKNQKLGKQVDLSEKCPVPSSKTVMRIYSTILSDARQPEVMPVSWNREMLLP